jgi:hypothetical protein
VVDWVLIIAINSCSLSSSMNQHEIYNIVLDNQLSNESGGIFHFDYIPFHSIY